MLTSWSILGQNMDFIRAKMDICLMNVSGCELELRMLHQFMNDGYWTKPTHASVAWSLGLTTCQNLSVRVRRYFRSRITSAAYPDICRASTHASVVTGAFDTLQNRPSIKDDTYLKTVTEDIFLKLYCVWLRILISNLGFFWHWTSLLEWWLKVLDMATIPISSL